MYRSGLLVEYENLCVKEVVKGILEFLRIPYSNDFDSIIKYHMSSQVVEKTWPSIFRNATEVVNKWKTEMDKNHIKEIEKSCKNVIKMLGYNLLI